MKPIGYNPPATMLSVPKDIKIKRTISEPLVVGVMVAAAVFAAERAGWNVEPVILGLMLTAAVMILRNVARDRDE